MIKITKELLGDWFSEINRKYFDGELKTPKNFIVSKNRSRLGQFRPHTWEIEISTAFIRSERDYYNTFLHEICHLYVSQKYKGYTKPHGMEWKAIASRITSLTGGKYGDIRRMGGSQDEYALRNSGKSKFVAFIDYRYNLSIGKYSEEKYVELLMKYKTVAPNTKIYRLESDDPVLCKYSKSRTNCRNIYWHHPPKGWNLEDILAKCTIVDEFLYKQYIASGVQQHIQENRTVSD